jgi:chromosome segregation ATPase
MNMKKITFSVMISLVSLSVFAQNYNDLIRQGRADLENNRYRDAGNKFLDAGILTAPGNWREVREELNKVFNKAVNTISSRDATIKNRDNTITGLRGDVARIDKEVSRLNGVINIRDSTITRLRGDTTRLSREVNRLNSVINTRDNAITGLRTDTASRNREIERLNRESTGLSITITRNTTTIDRLKEDTARLNLNTIRLNDTIKDRNKTINQFVAEKRIAEENLDHARFESFKFQVMYRQLEDEKFDPTELLNEMREISKRHPENKEFGSEIEKLKK